MKHYNVVVKGRVQGVFFRARTTDEANRLGLKGYVENRADGSVYIEVEGDEFAAEQFLDWCKVGPSLAKVEECIIAEAPVVHYVGFNIRR